jgi:hypothetical protein
MGFVDPRADVIKEQRHATRKASSENAEGVAARCRQASGYTTDSNFDADECELSFFGSV